MCCRTLHFGPIIGPHSFQYAEVVVVVFFVIFSLFQL